MINKLIEKENTPYLFNLKNLQGYLTNKYIGMKPTHRLPFIRLCTIQIKSKMHGIPVLPVDAMRSFHRPKLYSNFLFFNR